MNLRTQPSQQVVDSGSVSVLDHALNPGVRIREDIKQVVHLSLLRESNMADPSGAQFNYEVTADDP